MKKTKLAKKQILEHLFSIMSPGKPLRAAIDRIQEANLGAIIVLGDPKKLSDVMRGGFELNTAYTPQKVYELSKMDGAIILSENIKTIHGANIQLQPDSNIKTDESGTRHQAANRIAKQKGNLVIAVSERRNKITVYKGDFIYSLNDLSNLLVKSSQAITALEKYSVGRKKLLDIGCGSGILMLIGKKMGIEKVTGIDIDEKVEEVVLENFDKNDIKDNFQVIIGNLVEDINEKYDIVVSNILVDVLTELLESIEKTLEENATVIFSGILAEKEEAFTEKAEKYNLQKLDRKEKNNWVSLVFKYTK